MSSKLNDAYQSDDEISTDAESEVDYNDIDPKISLDESIAQDDGINISGDNAGVQAIEVMEG